MSVRFYNYFGKRGRQSLSSQLNGDRPWLKIYINLSIDEIRYDVCRDILIKKMVRNVNPDEALTDLLFVMFSFLAIATFLFFQLTTVFLNAGRNVMVLIISYNVKIQSIFLKMCLPRQQIITSKPLVYFKY